MEAVLKSKVERVFGSLAVDKRDALQAGFELMPRFVTEFLLAKAREKNSAVSIADVRSRVQKYSVDADRKNEFISRLMLEKSAQLIALIEVDPKPERQVHVGRITQLDGIEIAVDDAHVREFPELLYGGLWGSCALRYDTTGKTPRVVLESFQPYQLTRPDMDAFRSHRGEFTLTEWMELLIASAGYRAEAFPTFRDRLLLLTRLVPLVQRNVNLIELGPRGTGKTYLLRNISPRVFTLSGARATPAKLLYDLQRKELGIIGKKKVVVFDEVAATSFTDNSLVASLKDYMESGTIGRANRSLTSECSLYFAGNLDLDAEGRLPSRAYAHLFEALPGPLCDVAIADRIHGFIPGWELPKIDDHVLADGVGLLSDYFGEVLGELRRDLLVDDYLRTHVEFSGATARDRTAIQRVAGGLLKMLYPHGRIEEEGLTQVLQVATELRQRVHDQMGRMAPGEFAPKTISFPGFTNHGAPDLLSRHSIDTLDVEVNQRALIGKITILTVTMPTGGGDVGFVECGHLAGSGVSMTGLRGQVLDQSVKAAYDCLLHLGSGFGLNSEHLRSRRMAVHLVNIADPKDGPSAGLAFALAMLSAATGRKLRKALAVTGEISLQGNVGAVGGVPEKLDAAIRHGRQVVIIPAANAPELARLGAVTGKLEIHPVHTLADAIEIAFE